jgi:hypothetical protein
MAALEAAEKAEKADSSWAEAFGMTRIKKGLIRRT